MECDSLELAQEYCDIMTQELNNGDGPILGNVTKYWDIPRQTDNGKWIVQAHYEKEKHDKAPLKLGRASKPFDSAWFDKEVP